MKMWCKNTDISLTYPDIYSANLNTGTCNPFEGAVLSQSCLLPDKELFRFLQLWANWGLQTRFDNYLCDGIYSSRVLKSLPSRTILYFFPIFGFLAINQISGWWILRFWNVRGVTDFQDLNAVLYNTDCYQTIGWKIFESQSGEPCQNYVYGSTLIRTLDLMNLGASQRVLIGWIAISLISIGLAIVASALYAKSKKVFVLSLVASISPPVLLLAERGNFDWLIFVCIYSSALCFSKNFKVTGYFILFFSSLLKFYTFPLLIIALIFMKTRKELYLGLLLSCVAISQIILDLLELRSIYIGAWFAAFGNSIWAKYLVKFDLNLGDVEATLLGLIVTVAILIFLFKFLKVQIPEISKLEHFTQIDYFALFSSITFLGCYFAGLNYDYRLIFLIPSLWFVAEMSSNFRCKSILGLFLLSFLFSYNVKYFQPIGDLAINVLVAFELLVLMRFFSKFVPVKLRSVYVR